MKAANPGMLNVVLCWHMHQPDYRHQGEYLRPWTWLHAIKDYSDMAAHLETVQGARAVVNFSPVLIEQLQDYPARIRAFFAGGSTIGDAILDALAGQVREGDAQQSLMRSLLRVNEAMVKPRFETYAQLFDEARRALDENRPMARQQLDDLIVWYVLAWLGESLREEALPKRLQSQAVGFTESDRLGLLAFVGEVCGELIPRYRALADAGIVELSVTPFAHPILPLLVDLACARDAWPEVVIPGSNYPGGESRCDWHLDEAKRVFREAFGREPAGCWPSEGGISAATLQQLQRHGFSWAASGARVLFNSLDEPLDWPQLSAWTMDPADTGVDPLACFFRDDELSDRIGFEYSRWPASDAVEDLVRRIEQIDSEHDPGAACSRGESVLSIIMDGENAWEYFPCNGYEFLHLLYEKLGHHPRIRLGTYTDVLKRITPRQLTRLAAGSWVHGTFSTWVGDAAKNRAWDLLTGAKSAVDAALAPEFQVAQCEGREPAPWVYEVLRQLAVCEASDWFWWLGDDNRLEDGPAFDLLYRQQLAGLYELIGMAPPAVLDEPVNGVEEQPADFRGAGAGAMRTAS